MAPPPPEAETTINIDEQCVAADKRLITMPNGEMMKESPLRGQMTGATAHAPVRDANETMCSLRGESSKATNGRNQPTAATTAAGAPTLLAIAVIHDEIRAMKCSVMSTMEITAPLPHPWDDAGPAATARHAVLRDGLRSVSREIDRGLFLERLIVACF
jgi:hypothetical protein